MFYAFYASDADVLACIPDCFLPLKFQSAIQSLSKVYGLREGSTGLLFSVSFSHSDHDLMLLSDSCTILPSTQ